MLDAVESLGSVAAEQEAWALLGRAVMDKVLHVTRVCEAGLVLLTGHLRGVNEPRESGLERVCEATSEDLIDCLLYTSDAADE